MERIPTRRVVPYLLGALAILAGGAWVLLSPGDASPAGESVVVLDAPSIGEAGAAGNANAGGGVDTTTAGAAALADPRPAGTTSTVAPFFVQVAGQVRRPGVYQVPAGSRVFEVIELAGGVTEEADEQALPLAAAVTDGCRIVVPSLGDPTPVEGVVTGFGGGPSFAPGSSQDPVRLSLSTATAEQLEALPGIGPKTAERITAYREEHGPFATVDDLDAVPGIGPATVENLRDLVTP